MGDMSGWTFDVTISKVKRKTKTCGGYFGRFAHDHLG